MLTQHRGTTILLCSKPAGGLQKTLPLPLVLLKRLNLCTVGQYSQIPRTLVLFTQSSHVSFKAKKFPSLSVIKLTIFSSTLALISSVSPFPEELHHNFLPLGSTQSQWSPGQPLPRFVSPDPARLPEDRKCLLPTLLPL